MTPSRSEVAELLQERFGLSTPESYKLLFSFAAAASMSKREQFAAMAMQGLLARLGWAPEMKDLAVEAVLRADALLAALAETESKP